MVHRFVSLIGILVHLFAGTTGARLSPPRNGGIGLDINNKSLLNIRGGDYTEQDFNKSDEPNNLTVQVVLIPRHTSFLKPLRFLSLLLLNMSFNSCLQTKGKPFEDTIRRIMGMQTPSDNDDFASKVTPLHTYVARKIRSSSSNEMIPPSHLPSPLPLLSLLLSIIFFIGGTILLPRWSVGVDVLLNYKQIDVKKDKQHINDASYALQQWFEDTNNIDSYYATSKSKKDPSVLVHDKETKKSIICPLLCSHGYNDDRTEDDKHLQHPRRYYFELNNSRYYYDPSQSQCIVSGGPTLHKAPLSRLQDTASLGLQSNAQLEYAQERYLPYADISIPVPSLRDAFVQRLTSPLISLQLLGKLLSLVEEESIGRALVNLVRLAFQHLSDANRSIATAKHLAEEVKELDKSSDDANEASRFWALRPVESEEGETVNTDWTQVSPKELLPGDLFVIAPADSKQHGSSLPIPVDALLLDGTCVTEEAALTGESVPQAKVPLEFTADSETVNDCTKLDMSGIHRNSCIFSGTKLLYSSTCDEDTADDSSLSTRFDLPPLPFTNDPALFLALRSGAYSSRGEIIQSLLKSRANTSISGRKSDAESMKLIGSLALFAIGACVFLLLENTSDTRHPSVLKLIVQCTRILIASVPSDLPPSLSASAHTCANNLREMYNVVNSNTEALIESSQIDTVVFDKTGTLTADTQSLTSIIYPPDKQHSKDFSSLSQIVLAGSHSLIGMADDEGKTSLIGDPLDLACLQSTKWQYNSHEKSAVSNDDSVKLWQIRTFPFDPTTKMSSAIVLVKGEDGAYQLFVVVKGSPSKVSDLVDNEDGEEKQQSWYDSKVKRLGKKGFRTISLGALDVSRTSLTELLFPSGLPKNESKKTLDTSIHKARRLARSEVVRNDIEMEHSTLLNRKEMMFAGFACFNAPMRVSSSRVVNDLKDSEIDVIMLTGDEPYASLAMASKADITKGKQTCLLKTDNSRLVWKIDSKARHFSLKTAKRVQRQVESGESVLVVTGNAINSLLSAKVKPSKATQYVKQYVLPQTKVVASASPNDKSLFVHWLKNSCNRQTLMCGDGVNDIKAMQQASVSVAMLGGFGQEVVEEDTEDIRRKERLKRRLNSSNGMTSSPSSLDQAGIGDSVEASIARIRDGINKGICRLENENNGLPQHTTVFDIGIDSIKVEIQRFRDMRKGGTAAAKILAQEDRLRQSMESKSNTENELHEISDEIQAGESCLASSFTLLRPCISGVESILRTGISSAACCIAIYRTVALNCILTSYNLATLYKNGLRYGKIMWQIELWSSVYTDNASFTALSSPRPKLVAGARPSKSPFHPAEVVSTVLQAIIHIVTLTCAVNTGKHLESKYPTIPPHKGFSIKWSNDDKSPSVGGLLTTLVGSSSNTSLHSDTDSVPKSFFKRTPFQPNYIANNVFIMSIFQAAVTTMVNHSGKPFSIGFVESRQLCLSVCSIFLLCIVCISGRMPKLNSFIELAPYPTKASKVALLRLLLLNVSLSYFAEYFSMFFFR